MPARTPRRPVVNTPGKSRVERSARRWYLRQRGKIVYGCRIVLLCVATAFILTRLLTSDTKDAIHSTSTRHCIPRAGDFRDSSDPLYRSYVPLGPPTAPFPVLAAAPEVPVSCLEDWIVTGRTECEASNLESRLDVVWTWVNGSDLRWKKEMAKAMEEEGIFSPGFHFREQNELQYSMRSVMSAMSASVETVHLVVADLHASFSSEDSNSRTRQGIAQTPSWLNFGQVGCGPERPRLQLSTHHEIFHLPSHQGGREQEELDWREKALPTFNSKAIESRIGWLPGLGEAVLSFNDDFFLLKPHATADFYSTLYGTVIRFDEGFYQQVRPVLDKRNLNDAGETGGLWHANHLLSKRFPKRLRPYLPHVPKVVTRSLHHEAGLMFEDHLFNSTQRRFRESIKGAGDIQLQWLLVSLRVERWREALLWTYIVANLGTRDANGSLGTKAKAKLSELLGPGEAGRLDVVRGERWTLRQMRDTLARAGSEGPKATEILFSSMDGHLPSIPRPGMPTGDDKCTMDLNKCFGPFWIHGESVSAAEIFKRITFEHPDCGDCLIMALVTASGPLGLSAFLPGRRNTFISKAGSHRLHAIPILPITDTWQAADFSLDQVISDTEGPGPVNLRRYAVRLLSRYLYVSGRSKAEFHMINKPDHAARTLDAIDAEAAMLGLNDNIERDAGGAKEVMTEWFQRRWPTRTIWERR